MAYYSELSRDRYDKGNDWRYRDMMSSEMLGVRKTLNKLGIKIEGVNA